MKAFSYVQAEKVAAFTPPRGNMTLVFCSPVCLLDWRDNKTRYPKIADRNLYGCWQCGEDLTQGMNLAGRGRGDDNIYRISRTGRL